MIDEWNKAMEGQLTQDCRRTHCTGCGICQNLGVKVIDYADSKVTHNAKTNTPAASVPNVELTKYRAQIRKGREIAVLSHLDYVDLYARALVRSKLPIAYSEGFNPHIKMSFATALAVGVTSDSEYMDFQLTQNVAAKEVLERLNQQLPRGAEILKLQKFQGKVTKLTADENNALLSSYEVRVPYNGESSAAQTAIKAFNETETINYTRITPKKTRDIEIKQYIFKPIEAQVKDSILTLKMDIKITLTGSIKPSEVVHILHERFNLQIDENKAQIHRTKLTSVTG